MAIISDFGKIQDFSVEGNASQNFPLLPKKLYKRNNPKYFIEIPFERFAFYHNGSMFYISCNTDAPISKHYINYEHKAVKNIPNSKIINLHAGTRFSIGFQIKNYFWVLGGRIISSRVGQGNFSLDLQNCKKQKKKIKKLLALIILNVKDFCETISNFCSLL